MEITISRQGTKVEFWTDESGIKIPFNRITKTEKLRETRAYQFAKKALALSKDLAEFKAELEEGFNEISEAIRAEANAKESKGKGNFTWFNFDRSIKMECNINEPITFDDTLIQLCQEKLNQFFDETGNMDDPDTQLMREIVKDAFQNTKGRLDANKVMSLLKHRSKIKKPLYQEAMVHLEESIRRPKTKPYYRVFVRNEQGEYQLIDLNISSIQPSFPILKD